MAGKKRGKKGSTGRPRRRWLGAVLRFMATAAVWAVIAAGSVLAWYAYDLPDVDEALAATRRPTVTLLSADGAVIATRGDLYGLPVRLDQLPPSLPRAVLATEDRRFYNHFGIDIIALARAALANLRAGRIVQGGSTITQQVAKNLFLTPERTIKRKVQELLLAFWLESRLTKDQIFAVYLNRVYLGSGAYGVEAAARRYFARPARRLTAYQSAMLAGMLKAPSRYNPIADPGAAAKRTRIVLSNMTAAGYLTAGEAKALAKRKGDVAAPARAGRHFADWVLDRVSGYVTPGDRDLSVVTTLDRRLQRRAEAAVAASGLKSEAALVALSPDGAVIAMVGGRDYAQSQFNRATQALRQPGSAFKPVVYLAGLEAGLRPDSTLVDRPLTVAGWRPRNFERAHQGPVTLRRALARSINTVAVQVAERAGRARVISTARRLGITAVLRPEPSLALGAAEISLLELTAAYVPFANGGTGVWTHAIQSIRDSKGRVLYRRRGSGPGRVVAAPHVAAMNDMLAAAVDSGTGRRAAFGHRAAGKTGTSQNHRDAWFVGYTAHMVAGVWMGHDDGRSLGRVTGGGAPARLWRSFMAGAHEGLERRPLPGLPVRPGPRGKERPGPGFWKKLLAGLIPKVTDNDP